MYFRTTVRLEPKVDETAHAKKLLLEAFRILFRGHEDIDQDVEKFLDTVNQMREVSS